MGRSIDKENWVNSIAVNALRCSDIGKTDSAKFYFYVLANLQRSSAEKASYTWLHIMLLENEGNNALYRNAAFYIANSYKDRSNNSNLSLLLQISKDCFLGKRGYYSPFYRALNQINLLKGSSLQEEMLITRIRIKLIAGLVNDPDLDVSWMLRIIETTLKKEPVNSIYTCQLLFDKALLLERTYDYTMALNEFQKCDAIFTILKVKVHPLKLNTNIHMIWLKSFSTTDDYYGLLSESEKMARELKDSASLAEIYFRKGIYAYGNDDYEPAILLFNKSLQLKKGKNENVLYYLGLAYQVTNRLDLAILHFQKLLNSEEVRMKSVAGLYFCYKQLKDNRFRYYESLLKKEIQNHSISLTNFYTLNWYYKSLNDKDKLIQLENAFVKQFEGKSNKINSLASIYNQIGNRYFKDKDYFKALGYYQKMITTVLPDENNQDLFASLNYNTTSDITRLCMGLNNKGEAFFELFKHTTDSALRLRYLQEAYKNMALTIGFGTSNRLHKTKEEKKFLYGEFTKNEIPLMIDICFHLQKITGNNHYFKEALRYAEMGKSAVLLAMFQTKEGAKARLIPENLQKLEDSISFEENLLTHKLNSSGSEQERIKLYENLARLNVKTHELETVLEQKYPSYYHLKYEINIASIQEIQSVLKPNEAVLEYLVRDSGLYTFYIEKDTFITRSTSLAFDLPALVQQFYFRIHIFNTQNYLKDSVKSFSGAGFKLYNTLIKPFENQIGGKSLIIVSDNVLNLLPFEALITQSIADVENYKDLPYLMRRHPITYVPSLTILHGLRNQPPFQSRAKLLAIAPIYSSLKLKDDYSRNMLLVRGDTSLLAPLPFAKKEIEFAHKIAGGKLIKDENATESRFKAEAGEYDILHLATHGLLNTSAPLQSNLLFARDKYSGDDGFLYTYEIYNLKLKAQLVILSACNTGSGRIYGGEGVISLARGFLSSGSRSVMMTLWSVNDKASSQLVSDFYSGLSQKRTITGSLQQAKINYLKNADQMHAHPYFWAGLVLYGNTPDGLRIQSNTGFYIALTLIMSIMLVLLFLGFRKFSSGFRLPFGHK